METELFQETSDEDRDVLMIFLMKFVVFRMDFDKHLINSIS